MSLVSLDVGGKLFKTSLETLRKFPASKLAEIVSSANNNNLQDVISLDVDPEYFSVVLNWLRYIVSIMPHCFKILFNKAWSPGNV